MGYICASCLERIEVKCGDTIIQKQEEFNYEALPDDYSWLSVCPRLNANDYAILYYRTPVYYGTKDRTAEFDFYMYFKDGTNCSTACTITQSKLEPIVCENAYSIRRDNVGVLYNIESATTPTAAYALSCEEQSSAEPGEHQYATLACYTRNDKYSIPDVILSATTDVDWLTLRENTTSVGSTRFNFNVSHNKTPIREISSDYDGSTRGRTANITLLLMKKVGDNEYVQLEDDNGITCPGVTFPVYQKGFSGYCPTCQSINKKEEGEYIKIDYTGYGEPHVKYDESSPDSIYVPGLTGDGTSDIALFEFELNIQETSYEGTKIDCFYFILESDNDEIVTNSLHIVPKPSEPNKYVVYGILNENKGETPVSISVMIYLAKHNFLDGDNPNEDKCLLTRTLGFLKLLN